MSNTTKPFSEFDPGQIQQKSYNPVNGTIGVDGFIVGAVGRRIVRSVLPDTVTEQYDFYDGSNLLYTIQLLYTDSTLATLISVTRSA
jgi:hypothetical protein